jgi:HlyD family secretion protein
MRLKILILALIVAVVGGVWAWHEWSSRHSEPTRLHGNVDIREVHLGFRVPGRVATIRVDEGDTVKPGQELARLDDLPFRHEVEQAEGMVVSAKARLEMLQSGSRPQEVAQARAVLREREAVFANTERVFQRQEELLRTRAVSQQARDDAEAAFHEARARVSSVAEQLKLLEEGFRPEEVEQAAGDLRRSEAVLALANVRLQDTVLRAPSDGVVLTRAQEPGAVVQTGSVVLTVSVQRPVWVRAFVPEPDLGKVPPGTRVLVHTDSRPGQPYTGRVGFVAPRAEFTPKNVETEELRPSLVYRMRVVVDEPDTQLLQGMPVTITLQDL